MTDGATLDAQLSRAETDTGGAPSGAGVGSGALALTLTRTHAIGEVEAVWRAFEAAGIESPGQSFDFIRLWTEARRIPVEDQLYLVAALDGRPLALLPLHRHRRRGVRIYSWFPGPHVGCNAPLVDASRFAALGPEERRAVWRAMLGSLDGADVVYLRAVPERTAGIDGLFAELGRSLPVETLYRSEFASWEQCNATQRSKSRRKHDRQQGERLEALGEVSFEAIAGGAAARPVLDIMFRQRARRFEAMGVDDPFAPADVARFYNASVAANSGIEAKLHVLRLDGEIVAVRYNIVHGDRLFCLISSMSDDPRIQGGSPGKQCLLRVMQTVFDAGYRAFDMGAGFTDEKRHWCNTRIGLRNHYAPLTAKGRLIIATHALWQSARARIKANKTLLKAAKSLRSALQRHAAPSAAPGEADASD
jgi:CelD/BcsL family acetyltransferase involved in cellulose biosynthesis